MREFKSSSAKIYTLNDYNAKRKPVSEHILSSRDYNIVEFTTKANTLDSQSMRALSLASENKLIIINNAMQFSAGVNLNYVLQFAQNSEWRKIRFHYT